MDKRKSIGGQGIGRPATPRDPLVLVENVDSPVPHLDSAELRDQEHIIIISYFPSGTERFKNAMPCHEVLDTRTVPQDRELRNSCER